ncbi:MAG: hypothetical protein Q4G54_12775 [Pelistega sp.]|nr:hypothetical protein [Pelistega sp.]
MSKLSFTKLSAALALSVFLSACDNSSDNQKASQAGATEQSKVEQTTPVEVQKDTQNTEGTTGSTGAAAMQETAPTPAHNHAAPETSSSQTQAPVPESSSDPALESNELIIEFTAYGANPNWRAVIKDETLELEGEEGIEEGTYKVERSAYAKGVEYFGKTAQHEFSLNIHGAECHDTAGQVVDFTVSFTYGKQELKGCAVASAIDAQD